MVLHLDHMENIFKIEAAQNIRFLTVHTLDILSGYYLCRLEVSTIDETNLYTLQELQSIASVVKNFNSLFLKMENRKR